MTSKYAALGHYLLNLGTPRITMTFTEIEDVIGAKLPPKSAATRSFWSNNVGNNVMTAIWLEAGYRTCEVDIKGQRLTFQRFLVNRDIAEHVAALLFDDLVVAAYLEQAADADRGITLTPEQRENDDNWWAAHNSATKALLLMVHTYLFGGRV